MMNKDNTRKYLSILALVAAVLVLGFSSAKSDNSSNILSGYGWGADNGSGGGMNPPGSIGWFSFNCLSVPGGCSSSNYFVSVDPSTKYLAGYAWSSHYGWLKFGGLSGFPSGSGTTADNAKKSNEKILGWARFCSVFASGCSGALKNNLLTGGWDGWVSLSGTNYGVGYNETTGRFSGYGWGGGDTLGWVNFDNVLTTPATNGQLYLRANGNTGIISVKPGTEVIISSSGEKLEATGTATGDWSGSRDCPTSLVPPFKTYGGDTITAPAFPHAPYNFTLTCMDTNGNRVESTVTVTICDPTTECLPPPPAINKKPKYKER